jgi:hypothetical protein
VVKLGDVTTGIAKTALDELLRKLARLPLLGAQLVGRQGPPLELDVAVGTSATTVQHSLGAVPRMVVLGPPNVQARVWQPVGPTRTALTLQADTPCVVRAFVF